MPSPALLFGPILCGVMLAALECSCSRVSSSGTSSSGPSSSGTSKQKRSVPPAVNAQAVTPADRSEVQGARGWDWNGIIGTGQSLSVGASGAPLRATRQPYRNLKLDLGSGFFANDDPESDRLSLVPLVEPIRPRTYRYPGAYPRNIFGETPHTCMGSQITARYLEESGGKGDYVTVHSVVGESGQAMKVIGKGAVVGKDTGRAYSSSLFEARAITRLSRAAGKTFGIGAIVLTHGETDAELPSYGQALYQLVSDYNADLPAITGQAGKIPLLLTQQNSTPSQAGSLAHSAQAALRASMDHPRDVVCVGPKYQYSYVEDGVHLDSLGYDRLGEKYGQVYFERVVLGRAWSPLAPNWARRAGNAIELEFRVPVPPLVWDAILPPPHRDSEWANGRGFEVMSGASRVAIRQVEIVGNRVLITCEPGAHAEPWLVRYAMTASAAPSPAGTRRWGQLRDSDPFVGVTTRWPQPNYAVAFELQVE